MKNAFKDLRMLPCFDKLLERVKNGDSPTMIARWLHAEGYMADIKFPSLRAKIFAYRRQVGALGVIEKQLPAHHKKALAEIDAGLNELQEIRSLYAMQKSRIEEQIKLEQMLNFPNKGTGNEFRIAAELLTTSYRMKNDMGAGDNRAIQTSQRPGSSEEDVEMVYGRDIAGVVSDPGKRQRVIDTVYRSLSVMHTRERESADNVIDAEDVDDRAKQR